MYEYKVKELEDIKALRAIIEYMLNHHYLRVYYDGAMNVYANINVALLFNGWTSNKIVFAYNDGNHRGYLKVLEEITTAHFWNWLRDNNCLLNSGKTNSEYALYLRDRGIGYVSKYVKQNVLVRNVRLLQ